MCEIGQQNVGQWQTSQRQSCSTTKTSATQPRC